MYMYVCMYRVCARCMYVCMCCMNACTIFMQVHLKFMYICMFVCAKSYVCMYVCMYWDFFSVVIVVSLCTSLQVTSASASLAVLETTNDFFLPSLFALITPESCLCWMRALTANALATDGRSWTELFAYQHSGTYPNQWQVLDMNKFQPGIEPGADLFWVLEEIPGEVRVGCLSILCMYVCMYVCFYVHVSVSVLVLVTVVWVIKKQFL